MNSFRSSHCMGLTAACALIANACSSLDVSQEPTVDVSSLSDSVRADKDKDKDKDKCKKKDHDCEPPAGDGGAEPLYQVTILDENRLTHQPTAINNHRQITGSARNDEDARAAWFWDGEQTLFIIGDRAEGPGNATDVNDEGQVVGNTQFLRDHSELPGSIDFRTRPFFYQAGTLVDFPVLSGNSMGRAEGINAHGDVVGTTFGGAGMQHAVWWSNGEIIDIGLGEALAINASRQIVGAIDVADIRHAFLLDNDAPCTGIVDLGTLGGEFSRAVAINDDGLIVGSSGTAAGLSRAFLYRDGTMMELPTPGVESNALGINSHGDIVGNFSTPDFAALSFGYLYRDEQMTPISEVIANPQCWRSIEVADINDHGDIVGVGSKAVTLPPECGEPGRFLVVLTR